MKLSCRKGLTFDEVLIVTLLLSVIFAAAISTFISAMSFFNALQGNQSRLSAYLAMEHIGRKIQLGNYVAVDLSNSQLKIRWDYALGTLAPNNSPADFGDDTWVKYRFVSNKLFWRHDASQSPDVADTDTELYPGMQVLGASSFTLKNPTGDLLGSTDPDVVGVGNVIEINLVTQSGDPPKTITLNTDIAAGAMSKSQ